jgi:hypothetical protein
MEAMLSGYKTQTAGTRASGSDDNPGADKGTVLLMREKHVTNFTKQRLLDNLIDAQLFKNFQPV